MISRPLPAAFALASSVLATAFAAPCLASAESTGRAPAQVVHFSELNLNELAGVQVLYRRLESAARGVCRPALPTGTRIPSAAWQACMANAVNAAVKRVDRPLLSAYYDARIDGVQRRATRVAASH